jgi:hypothetical protein
MFVGGTTGGHQDFANNRIQLNWARNAGTFQYVFSKTQAGVGTAGGNINLDENDFEYLLLAKHGTNTWDAYVGGDRYWRQVGGGLVWSGGTLDQIGIAATIDTNSARTWYPVFQSDFVRRLDSYLLP